MTSTLFTRELARRNSDDAGRRWVYVPYDQLTDAVGPLSDETPRDVGIVLVESPAKAARRPYHKQKLALVLANQRQFALEQAERGVAVRYVATREGYREALTEAADALGQISLMEPAERELRRELAPLVADGVLDVVAHAGWLTTPEQFEEACGDAPPWRMDAFYRRVRRDSGLLMKDGKPLGGQFSMDGENREAWPGEPAAPAPPEFEPDAVTREVCDLVEERFADHPGALDPAALPATRADAERAWAWARAECMEHFGPFEDAFSERSRGLFHTRVAPLLNIHRLLPARVVREVAELDAPLASREGFVRQVLGWREFVRHVHRETDGLRRVPAPGTDLERPGDGGFGRWRGEPWKNEDAGGDGGAAPSALGADWPLPSAFWGAESGLRCLDHTVSAVLEDGWTHHIPRLMVLANLGTLLDVSPRELTDWFWVAFVDAYDWVVEPNVLGMGTYGAGDLMTTKPYVAGSNYIHKMGDHCGPCTFHPKRNCPIARLYWAFLTRHAERLSGNPRMNLVLASVRRRSAEKRAADERVFDVVRERLSTGCQITPDEIEAALS